VQGRGVQIVCTIGPASREPKVLEELIQAGMSIARLNAAHGDADQHRANVARIRAASAACDRPVAIMLDLSGPKLRLGEVHGGSMTLAPGDPVTLECDTDKTSEPGVLPVPDPYLPDEVSPGTAVLLGDGAVELEVVSVEGRKIHCRVIVGGEITSAKGVNAAGAVSDRPILGERDIESLTLAAELGLDLIGVSFVRTGEDLRTVRRVLRGIGRPIPLVAKIETAIALDHLDDILSLTDAVMVARGDLSLEVPYARVPVAQKRIVRAALRAGRPVITATQMLHSMISASRPTRAEATDVANAVLDGTDAVMLSEETAVGVNPVRACRAMARIIEETEAAYPGHAKPEDVPGNGELHELIVFARSAVRIASEVGARGILVWSRGGLAARMVSRERPNVPIVAPTRSPESYQRLALPYGIRPILVSKPRLTLAQLESRLGPLPDSALLLLVRHRPGEQRRIPWMALIRVADVEEWALEQDAPGRGPSSKA
jgi:pyruvate kinase